MATTTPSAALVPVAHVFTNTERLAVAGFLAGYGLLGREVAHTARGSRALMDSIAFVVQITVRVGPPAMSSPGTGRES
jgi:hypothetical protein